MDNTIRSNKSSSSDEVSGQEFKSGQEPLRRMSAGLGVGLPFHNNTMQGMVQLEQQRLKQQNTTHSNNQSSKNISKGKQDGSLTPTPPKKRALVALREQAALEDTSSTTGAGDASKRARMMGMTMNTPGGTGMGGGGGGSFRGSMNMGNMNMMNMGNMGLMNPNSMNMGNMGNMNPMNMGGNSTNPRNLGAGLSPMRGGHGNGAPNSPGSLGANCLDMPLPHTMGTDANNFAGANANLRLSLAALQQRRNSQQQQPNQDHHHQQQLSQNQQQLQMMQMQQDMQMQQFLQGQQQLQEQGFGGGAGAGNMMPSGVGSTSSTNQQQQQQQWMRNGGQGSQALALPSTLAMGSSGDDSLMQMQLFRQQQERLRQLEQMEEEASARRRQLQLLRGAGNRNMGGMPYGAGGMPGMSEDAALRESLFLQQQIQQQQQGGFSSNMAFQQGLLSSGPGSMSTNNSSSNTMRRGASSSSTAVTKARSPRPARKPASASTARATPMLGPIAPPVPAPPPHLAGQVSYKLPPVDESETPPHDQRVHVPLAIEEDSNWLSEFQSFVRQELLEVFRASHQDVKIRVASKKVFYKQVGIRCRYCAHCRPSTRAIRSSAFPSSIRQLYQSFTMMLRDHFGNCHAIPTPLKERFLDLKRNNTQGASDSMRYWVHSAAKLGMVDSDSGIVLNESTQAASQNQPPFGSNTNPDGTNANAAGTPTPPRLLAQPDDRETGTIGSDFLYTLLTQYQLIRLLPTECIGNRKSLRPGVPGLGCRYCCQAGRLGLSRVFPAKKKQMPGQVQDLYDHVRRCNLCPMAVKEELFRLKQQRDQSRSYQQDGDQKCKIIRIDEDQDKAFVDLLWQRLGHRGELATPAV